MPQSLPADVVGVAHVAGKYNFSEEDFLNEGAQALHGLGCKVIKVWFMGSSPKSYPFNSKWPEVKNLVELHGGFVTLQSGKGRGTTVTIELPAGGPAA